MPFAILVGVVLLLGFGLVVAVRSALAARQELENLETEIAESRGIGFEPDSEADVWSPSELEVLRDDDTEVDRYDPFLTLTQPNPLATWNAASSSNGPEPAPEPNGSEPASPVDLAPLDYVDAVAPSSNGPEPEPNGSEPTSPAGLAPLGDVNPVAWRATPDVPIIVLVVGAGFLGTGMTTGVTTAARLRQAWGEINESFDQSSVITLHPDAEPSPRSSPDPEEDSRISWEPRSKGSGPKPSTELKPIVWRAPTGARTR